MSDAIDENVIKPLSAVIKSQYPLQSALFMIDFPPLPYQFLSTFLILTPDAVNFMFDAISRQKHILRSR